MTLKNDEFFRQYIELDRDLIIILDKKKRVVEINKAARNYFNIKKDNISNTTCNDFCLLYHRKSNYTCLLDKVKSTKKIESLKITDETGDIWHYNFYPLLNNRSRLTGYIIKSRKITEDKKQINANYQTIFDKTGIAYAVVSNNNVIQIVNSKFEDLTGYTKEEVEGKLNAVDLASKEMQKKIKEYSTKRWKIDDSIPVQYESEILTKGGNIIPVLTNVVLLPDEQNAILTFTDISEIKEIEKSLVRSESKYESLFENIGAGFAFHEMLFNERGEPIDFIIQEVNDSFVELSGLTKEKLLERIFSKNPLTFLSSELDWIEIFGKMLMSKEETNFEQYSKQLDKWFNIIAYPVDEKHFVTLIFNITERKKLKNELIEKEERYRKIFSQNNDGIGITSIDGKVLEANERFLNITGYSLEELKGKKIQDITPKKWIEIEDQIIKEQLLKKGFTDEYEKEIIHKNGSLVPLAISAWIINDARGKPQYIGATIKDLTEQKEIERKIVESEILYKTLFDITGTANAIIDKDTLILVANSKVEELVGLTKEEIEGKIKATDLVIAEFVDIIARYSSERRRDPSKVPNLYETTVKDSKGNLKNVLVNVALIPGTNNSLVSLLDITDYREAKQALESSEKKYKELFDKAKDGIFLHSVNVDGTVGKFIEVNDKACELLDYTKEELLNLKPTDVVILDKNQNETLQTETIIEKGNLTYERILVSKNGKKISMEMNSHNFILNDENVILTIARDLTERKKAEEVIRVTEKRYQQLFNNANDAILLYNITDDNRPKEILELNKRLCELTNFKYKELISKKPLELFEAYPKSVLDLTPKIVEKGHYKYEQFLKTNDNRKIPVEINSHTVIINNERVVLSIIRDISERIETDKIKRMAYTQILNNIQGFANLIDGIKNPLSVIRAALDLEIPNMKEIIDTAIEKIIAITKQVDLRWTESTQFKNLLMNDLDETND